MLLNIYSKIPDEIKRNGLPKSFFEGRDAPSPDNKILYDQWAKSEFDKCVYGWSDGGVTLTGRNYYFLNHFVTAVQDTVNVKINDIRRPDFCWVDAEIFHGFDEADKQGKRFMMITGRGMGKTKIVTSVVTREFSLFAHTQSLVTTSVDESGDTMMTDIKAQINWAATNSPFGHNLLSNTDKELRSGFEAYIIDKVSGQKRKVVQGYQSIIKKLTFGRNAGITRGPRPNILVYEEVGAWSGAAPLSECLNQSSGGTRMGTKKKTLEILLGTGGMMKSGGSEEAREMFFNPDMYEILKYQDTAYYEGTFGKPRSTAFFVGSYQKEHGMYQLNNGINNDEESLARYKALRESMRVAEQLATTPVKSGVTSPYEQHIQEFPFNPDEAFLVSGTNKLGPEAKAIIDSRMRFVELRRTNSTKEYSPIRGIFVERGEEIVFEPSSTGPVIMYEDVKRDPDTALPKPRLYCAGIDSFDSEEGTSLGSMYIYKRFTIGEALTNDFVCNITFRPDKPEIFYKQCVFGSRYYNAITLLENTKIAITSEYKSQKMLKLLATKPENIQVSNINKGRNKVIGLTMPYETKVFLVNTVRNHILETSLQNCYDLDLLLDYAKFTMESNHDRFMASGLAKIQSLEMAAVDLVEMTTKPYEKIGYYTDSSGRKQFGVVPTLQEQSAQKTPFVVSDLELIKRRLNATHRP